ncbi:hypothetical protein [Microcoleus sp. bin38.metabat.b11b12b14.051]|uniref:hypothetical protein n=1 Tax=Microcoleus sp. bin38.metabat.b11b12b14.051 TaxID=2742709 RepID=UPI0025DAFECC|nr:hypothetical protein [Microcoleus sp. bin38.metabat.b11b12b14.051]
MTVGSWQLKEDPARFGYAVAEVQFPGSRSSATAQWLGLQLTEGRKREAGSGELGG